MYKDVIATLIISWTWDIPLFAFLVLNFKKELKN